MFHVEHFGRGLSDIKKEQEPAGSCSFLSAYSPVTYGSKAI
ncbi:hypothetical protein BAXH7_04220 [Bacillus amyloliquefaciens XH7]|nr:hypothetical protein LL3_04234 [Bacillus amyloliquefaciens LL3]AEK91326.1 hypothetical protein BAXH7_04220 [Bacillus amyloliquefaciens XH7]KYC92467.1 hypothetical protein B425_4122 [Bacillus amyloliquefaciens]